MEYIHNLREIVRNVVFSPEPTFTEKNLPDLSSKVYLVTGSSSGIGAVLAEFLAGAGATVYVTGSTPSRVESSVQKIRRLHPKAKVHGLVVNYLKLESVQEALRPLVTKETKLDGVVHNAGIPYTGPKMTKYGYFETLVVNVIGPQIVQHVVDPLLREAAKYAEPDETRVVWVSSSAHYMAPLCGGIDWDNLNNDALGMSGLVYYGQTKAMNIYQAILWGARYIDEGICCVSVHPGIIESDFRRNVPTRFSPFDYFRRPTKYGAYAELYLLVHSHITAAHNGQYYIPFGQRARIRHDIEDSAHGPRGQKMWRWVEQQVAIHLTYDSTPADSVD